MAWCLVKQLLLYYTITTFTTHFHLFYSSSAFVFLHHLQDILYKMESLMNYYCI